MHIAAAQQLGSTEQYHVTSVRTNTCIFTSNIRTTAQHFGASGSPGERTTAPSHITPFNNGMENIYGKMP